MSRLVSEIMTEMRKVETAKRNAERKRARCVERLGELKAEMKEATPEEGRDLKNQDKYITVQERRQD